MGVRFEMNVVGKGPVKVTLYGFFVVVGQCFLGSGYQMAVEACVLFQVGFATSVEKPSGASIRWRYTFPDESFGFG